MWVYLLLTEVAVTFARSYEETRPDTLQEDELALLEYLKSVGIYDRIFVQRLDDLIRAAMDARIGSNGDAAAPDVRDHINRVLHQKTIPDLQRVLCPLLAKNVDRVQLLVDNLDKTWSNAADIPRLCEVLLALMQAIGRVRDFLSRTKFVRLKEFPQISYALFLRADIYDVLTKVARESDKIPTQVISWEDPTLLAQIAEARYAASFGAEDGHEFWESCFEDGGNRDELVERIMSRIMHRPRDLIYYLICATSSAINRKHPVIQADDLKDADFKYSEWLVDKALLVEGAVSLDKLNNILTGLANGPKHVSEHELDEIVKSAGVEGPLDDVVFELCKLGILQVQIGEKVFDASEQDTSMKRIFSAAKRYAAECNMPRVFYISRPLHAVLSLRA